jgi:hypothetical protein
MPASQKPQHCCVEVKLGEGTAASSGLCSEVDVGGVEQAVLESGMLEFEDVSESTSRSVSITGQPLVPSLRKGHSSVAECLTEQVPFSSALPSTISVLPSSYHRMFPRLALIENVSFAQAGHRYPPWAACYRGEMRPPWPQIARKDERYCVVGSN